MITFKQFLVEKDMWGLSAELGVNPSESTGIWNRLHDEALPWINRNQRSSIDKLIKDPKAVLGSKLLFWKEHLRKVSNFSDEKLGTIKDFKDALDTPITLWRGGSGKYDPEHQAPWVSFTADRGRATTFSTYNGTHAKKSMVLDKNAEYWVVELTIPLDSILLYLDVGGDQEVIVARKDAKNAKLIVEHP